MKERQEFLDRIESEFKAQTARIQDQLRGVSDAELNESVPGGWSIGQIVQHLNITHQKHLTNLLVALENPVVGDTTLGFSLFGNFFYWAAGPRGNTIVPGPFQPPAARYGLEVLHVYADIQNGFVSAVKKSSSVDLVKTTYPNPVFKFIRVSLFECYSIIVAHNERHLGQIEARRKQGPSGS